MISPKHANFIENADRRDERRLRRAHGRGAATSARGVRRELEREVAFVGELETPVTSPVTVTRFDVGAAARAANPALWPGDGPSADRVGARARQASSSRFRAAKTGDRLDLARLVPSGRSLLIGFALVVVRARCVLGSHGVLRLCRRAPRGEGCASGGRAPGRSRSEGRRSARACSTIDARALEDTVRALPSVAGVSVDRAFPNTLVVKVAAERPVAVVRRGSSAWLATGSGKVIQEIETGTERRFPRLWLTRDVAVRVGRSLPPNLVAATRALAAARAARLPRRVKAVRFVRGTADAGAPTRARDQARGCVRRVAQAHRRGARVPAPRRAFALPGRERSGASGRIALPQLLG